MPPESAKKSKSFKLSGTAWAVIVMAIMVIALVVFVSVQERRLIVTETTLTQTAEQLAALSTGMVTPDPLVTPMPPASVVNVNGIVFMGGFLVLLVLAAVLREVVRNPK